jgi:tRNA pseudouridine55 synthase
MPSELNKAVAISYIVKCSSGTYIRSIARDIGNLLGCGGAVATLRRVYTQPFSIQQAVVLDDLSEQSVISLDSSKELSQFSINV